MRTSLVAAIAAAAACGLLIGGETTAFAWALDLVVVDRLSLSDAAALIGGLVGIAVGGLVSLWVGVKVYRAELALAASAVVPPPAAPKA
jgi:apolipoprotein N-acyltransferase